MDTGYVKLYRKILENPISTNLELVGLLSVLLLKANHKANSFFVGNTKVSVKPGQFVSSQKKLAIEFGVGRTKMIRLLSVLQDEKIVDIKGYTKYSLFTINRRSEYQNVDIKRTPSDTSNGHQTDTNKNDKNDKNEKNISKEEKSVQKENYGKFVLLFEDEYNLLVDRYGKKATQEYIQKVDVYVEKTNKQYKSHYKTLINRMQKDCVKDKHQQAIERKNHDDFIRSQQFDVTPFQ